VIASRLKLFFAPMITDIVLDPRRRWCGFPLAMQWFYEVKWDGYRVLAIRDSKPPESLKLTTW
jgi:ATP-dependent DNA ligase